MVTNDEGKDAREAADFAIRGNEPLLDKILIELATQGKVKADLKPEDIMYAMLQAGVGAAAPDEVKAAADAVDYIYSVYKAVVARGNLPVFLTKELFKLIFVAPSRRTARMHPIVAKNNEFLAYAANPAAKGINMNDMDAWLKTFAAINPSAISDSEHMALFWWLTTNMEKALKNEGTDFERKLRNSLGISLISLDEHGRRKLNYTNFGDLLIAIAMAVDGQVPLRRGDDPREWFEKRRRLIKQVLPQGEYYVSKFISEKGWGLLDKTFKENRAATIRRHPFDDVMVQVAKAAMWAGDEYPEEDLNEMMHDYYGPREYIQPWAAAFGTPVPGRRAGIYFKDEENPSGESYRWTGYNGPGLTYWGGTQNTKGASQGSWLDFDTPVFKKKPVDTSKMGDFPPEPDFLGQVQPPSTPPAQLPSVTLSAGATPPANATDTINSSATFSSGSPLLGNAGSSSGPGPSPFIQTSATFGPGSPLLANAGPSSGPGPSPFIKTSATLGGGSPLLATSGTIMSDVGPILDGLVNLAARANQAGYTAMNQFEASTGLRIPSDEDRARTREMLLATPDPQLMSRFSGDTSMLYRLPNQQNETTVTLAGDIKINAPDPNTNYTTPAQVKKIINDVFVELGHDLSTSTTW